MEDQLEEGEIIDDDDDDDEVVYNFEDISDDSIIDIPNKNGKFVSSNERLRALSLSSVSDTDITAIDNYNNKNRKHRKKSTNKHCKRHTSRRQYHHQDHHLFDTDGSDTDFYYQDDDLKHKLKEAIRISDDDDGIIKRCSNLETRLKLNHQIGGCDLIVDQKQEICDNLGGDNNNNNNRLNTHSDEDDDDIENLRLQALKTTEYNKYEKQDSNGDNLSDRNDKIDDSELENLRLEALKTAVLNKFQKRKRRKALQENLIVNNNQQSDNYKENVSDKILDKGIVEENIVDKSCNIKNNENEQNNQLIDLEEDEDVLRASLLANLAKKIKTTSDELNIVPEQQQQIINFPQKFTNNNHRSIQFKGVTKIPDHSKFVINNLTKKEPQRKIIPIKPLIINLKDDSDSEDDFEDLQKNGTTMNDTTKKPLDDLVEKFLKEQRAKFETQQLLKNESIKTQIQTKQFQSLQTKKTKLVRNNTNIMEKSAMKLLPKSAQLEYQELLKRLKTAEIKQKILKRKHLNRIEKSTAVMKTNEGGCYKHEEIPTKNEGIEKINDKQHSDETNKHLTALQKTLKEIRIQKNGSLQIKNKYQDLTPIMRKINEARNERKKYENLIKQLLNDLNEARNNLWKSHEKFSIHVKELIDRKAMIDKSVVDNNINKRNVKINNNSISNNINNSIEITTGQSTVEEKKVAIATPIQPKIDEITPLICDDKNDSCEDMEICTNEDEQELEEQQQLQIDIVDPNDIDEIYKKQPIKSCIPDYISPLTNYERYNNVDPYGIMCPYEVNGSCRDSECVFKHFLKFQDNAR